MNNSTEFNKSFINNFAQLPIWRNFTHCPLCKTKYNPLQANLMDEKEDALLVHIKCQKCFNSLLVLILNQGTVLSSLGLVTDLKPEDLEQIKQAQAIAPDDILALHQQLQDQTIIKQLIK